MKFCVLINKNQDKQLKDLKNFHEEKVGKYIDNFSDLVKEFVAEVDSKHKDITENLCVYPILECINQIIFSFKGFKESRNYEPNSTEEASLMLEETSKKELAMLFVFFLNAKAFLELVNNHTKINLKDNYELFKDIKK